MSNLGKLGIWAMQFRGGDRAEVRDAAAELAGYGYSTLWLPGLSGGAALHDVRDLLAAAPDIVASIGVLAIWGQPPVQVAQALARLDADYGPRTMLGLGISSPESAREAGETYGHPIPTMSRYLDGLAQAGRPVPADRVLLGALGPKMARLAAERTRGFHPFLVTPEYSARMRQQLGTAPWIAPHLAVVLDRDAARARTIARQGVGMAFGMPTYRANLTRLGFTEGDFVDGGSDRLIDAVVAHGDLGAVADHIRKHLDAGADHVAVQILHGRGGLPRSEWKELASVLPSL
jgi:probable F420-dependent oxidoreductase